MSNSLQDTITVCEPANQPQMTYATDEGTKRTAQISSEPVSLHTSPPELLPPPLVPRPVYVTDVSCGVFGSSWSYQRRHIDCVRLRHQGMFLDDRPPETRPHCLIRLMIDFASLLKRLLCFFIEDSWSCMLGCLKVCFCKCGFRLCGSKDGTEYEHNRALPSVYIVMGSVNSATGRVRESIANTGSKNSLFKAMREAIREVRPFYLRVFSLKTIGAFGLYSCNHTTGAHIPIEISAQTRDTLLELFRDFSAHRQDYGGRWRHWVHAHLNANSRRERDGVFSLQVMMKWSITRIVVLTTSPVILSLVVGLWYMQKPGSDPYVVAQTAWTIASYIVTAAGGMLQAVDIQIFSLLTFPSHHCAFGSYHCGR